MTREEIRSRLYDAQLSGETVRVTWRNDERYAQHPVIVTGKVTAVRSSLAEVSERTGVYALVPLAHVTGIGVVDDGTA